MNVGISHEKADAKMEYYPERFGKLTRRHDSIFPRRFGSGIL